MARASHRRAGHRALVAAPPVLGATLGVATRPVTGLLCALAPPILLSGVASDRFEVTLLLLLVAAKGAGWLSLTTWLPAGLHPSADAGPGG